MSIFSPLRTSFYRLRRLSRRLWVRASLVAGLGVILPWVMGPLSALVPDWLAEAIGAEDVQLILEILASSMLAVTIFSLSVMVSARQSASSQVTPRSHQLLLEDTTSQTVQATFLGAFVYTLIGLITLSTGYTADRAASVMLAFTLVVIALVVLAILRWIDHLTTLGSVLETTRRVERAAESALAQRDTHPTLGARALRDGLPDLPADVRSLTARRSGYVQYIDMAGLGDLIEKNGAIVWLAVQPGSFVQSGDALLHHNGGCADDDLRARLTLGDARIFDQDPRFGVTVLSEIAQRALSPGINDPGTAIDVLTRLSRLLDRDPPADDGVEHPQLWMPAVTAEALVRDGFDPIARDGAAMVEVQIRLQKALRPLIHGPDPALAAAARAASARALARAEAALDLPDDLDRLHAAMGGG